MLRTSTVGTLLGALLVLASGATVGFVAASQAPTPADATPVQPLAGNETNETADDGMMGNETAGNETMVGNETGEVAANATVTFLNQSTNGTAVLVNETTLPEGGFVVIHLANETSPGNFSVGPVVGNSSYLEAGTHEDVVVGIYENATLEESQWLIAMSHMDTNDNQVYEFPEADDPYTVDGPVPVTDEAYVEVIPAAELVDVTGNQTVAVENVTVENETAMGNETMGNESA